jgi:hypothetical protein
LHQDRLCGILSRFTGKQLRFLLAGQQRSRDLDTDSMFYCIPQQAYLSVTTCKNLRERPVGKAPAGAPPKLIACEKCQMHPLVDMAQIPVVSLEAYLGGSKPRTVNLNSPKNRKLLAQVA